MLGPSISKVLWCLQLHISLLCVACTAININKHKDILYTKEAKVDGDNSYETRSKPNHTNILSRVNLALCMLESSPCLNTGSQWTGKKMIIALLEMAIDLHLSDIIMKIFSLKFKITIINKMYMWFLIGLLITMVHLKKEKWWCMQ